MSTNDFTYKQPSFFSKHFSWLVFNPYIKEKEKDLLSLIIEDNVSSICEVGCGEGQNIIHLIQMGFNKKIIGLDCSIKKVNFCNGLKLDNANFIAGDGLLMPFKDNTFELVFCKNLLHHVDNKYKVISELVRICKPYKKIIIIEGNGLNLINIFFRLLNHVEVRMKEFTPSGLAELFKKNSKYKIVSFSQLEPSNLFRVILHYKWGLPCLARFNVINKLLEICNNFAYRFIPRKYWAYISVSLIKNG